MITIDAALLEQTLDYPSLSEAIRDMFQSDASIPERHHHTVEVPNKLDATLLLMPAWQAGNFIGVKIATIHPSNTDIGIPSVRATYLLLNGRSGEQLATIDGKNLTVMRTAATSALVSSVLSREDASTMTVVGAGALSIPLVRAHSSVRNISRIFLWNRTEERLLATHESLRAEGFNVEIERNLEDAVRESDIVSCATLSRSPLIEGNWIQPGTHLDLVGAYSQDMRETDAAAIACSSVYVDSISSARTEAGDLIQAAKSGLWDFDRIRGDLIAMTTPGYSGRVSNDEITLFKSVGSALEDLAAAILAFERVDESST